MTTTYLDAGVLISGVRGSMAVAKIVADLIRDTDRVIVGSAFLRLEVVPKAAYYRNDDELEFYRRFLARVTAWAEPIEPAVEEAERQAVEHGLNALDAPHVAAAILLGADELVTTEGSRKPIHRVDRVKIVTLR